MNNTKTKSIVTFLIFFVLNFAVLALGALFTGEGVPSVWYQNINKAPWTPPGRVFGFAWTTIMICFSFYMTFLWNLTANKKPLIILFTLQWVLNFSWNPLFFFHHAVGIALFTIFALTILVGYFLFSNWEKLQLKSIFIAPYFLWLLIATSLNAYIFWYN